jgi:UDP-N-acetylmuramoyl-tripeptide--D-alanyl-D-alanine ligase
MKEKILKWIYRFLARCGHRYTKHHKPLVIGITGSVGKTSCRMIIKQVLNRYLGYNKIYTSPKNFNSELGLVFSIFKIESYTP